jgi:hypothetical protein
MGGRDAACVEISRYLSELLTGGTFRADACDDLARHGLGTPGRRGRRLGRPWWSPALLDESLELVGWNESSAPRHLNRLNVREDAAVESRAADAERLSGLGTRIGESFYACCFANDRNWLRVPTAFLRPPLLTASRHQYAVHERRPAFASGCICVSPAICRSCCCTRGFIGAGG